MLIFRRSRIVSALIAGLLLTGCANQGGLDLGDAPAQLVSEREIDQMSMQTWERIQEEETRTSDKKMQRRAESIAERIVKAAGVAGRDWKVVVFESEQINAFALPGGRIGVYEGLMNFADNDAQIAAVLGHEVAHVTEEHSRERFGAAKAANLGVNAVNTALQAGNVGFANQIAGLLGAGAQYGVILPYGRTQELEADRTGLMTMAKAGYDPREAVAFWRKMQQKSSGGAPPEFASTHPSDDRRIAQLEEMLPEALKVYRANR